MAQAWAIKPDSIHSDDLGRLYVSYEVFVQKDDGTVAALSTTVECTAGMTPQQFRAALTTAMLYDIGITIPGITISANDCMIDVVQRGI